MTITPEAFYEFVAGRHSVRRFRPDPVADATVHHLLEAACRAPSAHNRQPWRFVVVRPGEARRKLVEAMSARFRADLERDRLPPEEVARLVQRGRERLLEPPVAIILCTTMEEMDAYPDARRQESERTMAIQSTALAGGHLLLAAQAEGLGACWMCAPLFAPHVAREALGLPATWEAQGVIVLGVPGEEERETPRRPLEEVTAWR